jgi:glycosyltransferase involved in cell wall biosynthesis
MSTSHVLAGPSHPVTSGWRAPTPLDLGGTAIPLSPGRKPPPLTLFPQISPLVTAVLFLDFAEPSANSLTEPWTIDDVTTLSQQRLAGVALRLLTEQHVTVSPAADKLLRAASFAAASRTVQLLDASLPGLETLQNHNIPFAISKGPGIALESHSLVERPFADLDVLVTPKHFRRAHNVLSALGYAEEPSSVPPWPWFDRHCREAVNLRNSVGGSLDLHHHLPPWLWTRDINVATLIRQSSRRPVGSQTLPLLSTPQNLLIVALHLVSDHNRPGQTLMIWRDLLTLAAACDPNDVLDLARRQNLLGWLRWVIAAIPQQARPPELWDHLKPYPGRPRHQVRLRHLLPPSLGSRHIIGQVLRLPAPQAACYLAGMALPSTPFLHRQLPGSPHPIRDWWGRSLQRIIASQRDGHINNQLDTGTLVTAVPRTLTHDVSVLMVAPGALFLSAISYYSAALARALQRHGAEMRLLLIRRLCPRFLYPGRHHVGQYDLAVLRLGQIPAHEELDWFSIPSLWTATRRLRDQRPDVLLLQWWTSAMAHNYLLLARRAKQLGCSVVLELHELRDVGEHGIPFASTYTNLMMSRLANHCDGVIVHSKADVHAVSAQYPALSRLPSAVIFHGPQEHGSETPISPAKAASFRRGLSGVDSPQPIRFLYFGVIRPYKGLTDLVRAFRALVQDGLPVHLTVAGEPWTDSDQTLAELRKCENRHYTTLLQYIPDSQVNTLFRDCDILVAPYRRASASGPISMAMGAGMPIVTTRLPALIEACDGYDGIEWADVADPVSLAVAMRRAIGRVGETYNNPPSWDTNADRYLSFFAEILPDTQITSA